MPQSPDDTHLASSGAGATREAVGTAARPASARLDPNQQFGPYRIVRELGRGGMGEVYEAEEIETGRRVALKLLSRTLADRQAVDRFLREGRLAAAVSHPNSVYVFGSHEIDGVPAIAMELVSGGTLDDAVEKRGPMPAADAVAAVLQVVAGLEAAEARGVLHRDIKPSNCFIDAAGVVKIGDYGLSMSTTGVADETRLTMAGTFLGTPAYASPEQVRAADLDVRSDIYAVGATLYFLLTGQPPFPQKGAMQVLAAVLQDAPASPRTLALDVPEALAQVVLRCLKKDPAARYQTYASLREALQPLARRTVQPANWSPRFAAILIDFLVFAPVTGLLTLSLRSAPATATAIEMLLELSYFALLEWRYGGSIGKRIYGLAVVAGDGMPVTLAQASIRASIWLFAASMGDVLTLALPGVKVGAWATGVALAVLFSTVSRARGNRGLHEIVSGTRTIVAPRSRRMFARRRPLTTLARPASTAGASTTGSFAIQERLWEKDDEALVAAWDAKLDRPVWIHHVRPGASAISPARQTVARETRLRWLVSRRTDADAWDAYEAPDGGPLGLEPWDTALAIVSDLAIECEQALADGTMPATTGVDRVWISRDGVARIADFSVPGANASPPIEISDVRTAQRFLHAVAVAGLGGNLAVVALPLSVRTFLDRLGQAEFTSFPALTAALADASRSAPRVSMPRRLIAFGLGSLLIVLTFWGAASNIPDAYRLHQRPEVETLGLMLNRQLYLERPTASSLSAQWMSRNPASLYTAPERQAFLIYIGNRFASTMADATAWTLLDDYWTTDNAMKALAERARQAAAEATPEVRQHAATDASRILGDFDTRQAERANFWLDQSFYVSSSLANALLPFGVISVILAFIFRGSVVLRLLGCAIAGPDGRRASWLRAWGRTVVAWLPVFVSYAVVRWGLRGMDLPAAVVPLTQAAGSMLIVVGALVALWRPEWSLHDRVAGTHIVPR